MLLRCGMASLQSTNTTQNQCNPCTMYDALPPSRCTLSRQPSTKDAVAPDSETALVSSRRSVSQHDCYCESGDTAVAATLPSVVVATAMFRSLLRCRDADTNAEAEPVQRSQTPANYIAPTVCQLVVLRFWCLLTY